MCVSSILEKFKEKKTTVVASLRDALDAIYICYNLEAMSEDLVEALNNKNPNVKAETALFLARAFSKTLPSVFNKKLLKTFTSSLIKTLNESDPLVRDASAEALGTLMKLLGERAINTYLVEIDPLKLAKIKEFADKSVITIKLSQPKKNRPTTAPVSTTQLIQSSSMDVKQKRPNSSIPAKKNVLKKITNTSSKNTNVINQAERELTLEEVELQAADILPGNVLSDLDDPNWKNRLSAVESISNIVNNLEKRPDLSQILLRVVCKKPGLKVHIVKLLYKSHFLNNH